MKSEDSSDFIRTRPAFPESDRKYDALEGESEDEIKSASSEGDVNIDPSGSLYQTLNIIPARLDDDADADADDDDDAGFNLDELPHLRR